ncbi:MAG: Atu1372/SO_1960 family protein, partial [Mesorhizobium sp.]
MAERIEQTLANAGVTLPTPAAPAANYIPYAISGSLLVTSGQLPLADGKLVATGRLGSDVDLAAGQA